MPQPPWQSQEETTGQLRQEALWTSQTILSSALQPSSTSQTLTCQQTGSSHLPQTAVLTQTLTTWILLSLPSPQPQIPPWMYTASLRQALPRQQTTPRTRPSSGGA